MCILLYYTLVVVVVVVVVDEEGGRGSGCPPPSRQVWVGARTEQGCRKVCSASLELPEDDAIGER